MEIVDTLEEAGWLVLEASSGEEAAELLPNIKAPDLLVTDIRLGGQVTGWDLAEICRVAHPAVAVIYASANPPITERFVAGGWFLEKPSLMTDLVVLANRLSGN